MRSDIAYEYVAKAIKLSKRLIDIQLPKENINTLDLLTDFIEFYDAEIFIIDGSFPELIEFEAHLKQADKPYVVLNDTKQVVPFLEEEYGLEEIQETFRAVEKEVPVKQVETKIIEKEIFLTNYQAIPSKVIVVGSLYRGAGSTLLATNLARMIAARGVDVAYIEHPSIKPYMFDYLQIHAEENIQYVDLAREVYEHGVVRSKGSTYKKHGVKWYVNDSRHPKIRDFTYEQLMTLSHGIQSTVLILDISNLWLEQGIQKYLYLADSIFLCVEPDPIKTDWALVETNGERTEEKEILDFLTQNEQLNHFQYVLMKNVPGIDIKLVKEMLHKRPIATLPYIEYGVVQQALFKSKLVYDVPDYTSVFEQNLIQTLAAFVPQEFVKLQPKERKFFGKFLKKI